MPFFKLCFSSCALLYATYPFFLTPPPLLSPSSHLFYPFLPSPAPHSVFLHIPLLSFSFFTSPILSSLSSPVPLVLFVPHLPLLSFFFFTLQRLSSLSCHCCHRCHHYFHHFDVPSPRLLVFISSSSFSPLLPPCLVLLDLILLGCRIF